MLLSRKGVLAGVFLAVLFCGPFFLSETAADPRGEGVDVNASVQYQNGSAVTIAEDLSAESGEVRVIVGLSTPAETGEADVGTLKEHADRSQANLRRFANRSEAITVENRFWLTNAVVVTVDTDQVPFDSLARVRGVERIEPDAEVTLNVSVGKHPEGPPPQAGPNGPSLGTRADLTAGSVDTTYGLAQINAPDVWAEYDTRGSGVTVAVLDTGVDADHPDIDLCSTCWAEFDETGEEIEGSDPHDPNGHGTHVSGTVIGGDASGQYIGVAPDSDLLHGKVINDGTASMSQLIAGIEWAVKQDADVLSVSLGVSGYDLSLEGAIDNAKSNGVTVVVSSGNDGEGTSASPGNYYSTIGIGATDAQESVAAFSSGETVDPVEDFDDDPNGDWPDEYVVPAVAAPGADVLSAYPGGQWASLEGTSMAAPHVAGAIALVQAATDADSHDEIASALEATASKPDDWDAPDDERDTRYGFGIVDASASIAHLTGETTAPDISLVDASIDTTTVLEGEPVTAMATVENTGDASGTFTADLRVDGTVVDTASVEVPPGASETVSFNRAFDDSGQYTITINDARAGDLTVEQPATFEVRGVTLASESIAVGGSTTVTASVENVGDREGTHTAGLVLDGETVDSSDVTLSAGETGTVTFERTFEQRGEYAIAVDGTAAGTLTVAEPASFEVADASIERTPIGEGGTATIVATIQNSGGMSGTFTAALSVDGEVITTRQPTISGGATGTVTFERTFEQRGEYAIAVNGTAAGTLTVAEPASFVVVDATLTPHTVRTGENATVLATVENTGGVAGTFTAPLELGGFHVTESTVTVGAGDRMPVPIVSSFDRTGEYSLAVSGVPAGTLTVTEGGPLLELSNVTLENETVEGGEEISVTADLTNAGEGSGTVTPTLATDGEPLIQREITLGVGESVTRSFEDLVATPGTHMLTLAGQPVGTVTVETGWTASYVNEEGVVNQQGLNQAVQDYLGDELESVQLNSVINSYLRDTPLDP